MTKVDKHKSDSSVKETLSKKEGQTPRDLVLDGLIDIIENKIFSHVAINQLLSKHQDLDKRDRAFVSRVITGTLEHLLEIDYIINQFSSINVKKMKPVIRNLLRSGVYQLKYMDNIPPSAACNEAVNMAGKRGFKNLTGFVNGNLRNIARNLEDISYPEEPLSYLEIKYSIPAWIINLWSEDEHFVNVEGRPEWDKIEKVAKAFQEKRPLTIRVNVSKIQPKVLKKNLERHGIKVEEHPYLDYAFKVSGIDYLEALEDFKRGNFYVQDVSSMLVAELANPSGDISVLDLCAAPGGKALHLADKMRIVKGSDHRVVKDSDDEKLEAGIVLACDLTEKKISLIQENIARAGFKNIKAIKRDATILDKEFVGKAKIVIADLPCSGLGILGKKPDLRYNTSINNVEGLVKLQRKILTNACAYVKPQGFLIFSTCTINPKENIENVKWLLEQFSDLQLIPILDELPSKLRLEIEEQRDKKGKGFDFTQGVLGIPKDIYQETLQLLPGINDSDGFFIGKFKKV